MKLKLAAAATIAFVFGHDLAVTRANRRMDSYTTNLDTAEMSELALRWFKAGREVSLEDPAAVAAAYARHFPTPPMHTQN